MILRARRSSDPAGPSAPDVDGLVVGALVSPPVTGRPAAWWAVDEQGHDVVVQRVRPASGTGVPLAALDEASRRRALPHPHLLPLLRVVRCREGAVQVLGPAPGGCLADLLAVLLADLAPGSAGLPVGQVVTLVAGLGSALAVLHEEGLVHGEVSPTGVVVDARGMPLLLGWGAARPVPPARAEVRRREARSTGLPAPGPDADVLALARLALDALGPAQDEGSCRLRGVLAAAAAGGPSTRPSAAALAAACWEVAPALPVDAPCARSRQGVGPAGDDTQLLRPVRRGAALVVAPADRAARHGRWRARWARRPVRWAVLPLAAAAAIGVAVVALPPEDVASTAASAPPVDTVAAEPTTIRSATSTSGPSPEAAADPRLTGGDPAAAVEALSVLRLRAISAGDAALLAAVDVPGSPAAQRDGALVTSMAGRRVVGLHVSVLSARAGEQGADGTWVEVVSAASAHRVVADDGVHDVPAGEPVVSRLLLRRDAGAWKVADVA